MLNSSMRAPNLHRATQMDPYLFFQEKNCENQFLKFARTQHVSLEIWPMLVGNDPIYSFKQNIIKNVFETFEIGMKIGQSNHHSSKFDGIQYIVTSDVYIFKSQKVIKTYSVCLDFCYKLLVIYLNHSSLVIRFLFKTVIFILF